MDDEMMNNEYDLAVNACTKYEVRFRHHQKDRYTHSIDKGDPTGPDK